MAFTNEDVQEIKEIVLETIAEESDPIENVQQVSELSDGDEVPIVRSGQGVNSYGRVPVNLFGGAADKRHNPAEFSGLGKVYLKKNIVEVGDVEKNILTQSAFYKDGTQTPNTDTVFVVQYDFDLNGQTITMPANSVLEFAGGSFDNGKMVLDDVDIHAGRYKIFGDDLTVVSYSRELNPNAGHFQPVKKRTLYASWFGLKDTGNNTDTFVKAVKTLKNNGRLIVDTNIHIEKPVVIDDLFYTIIEGEIGNDAANVCIPYIFSSYLPSTTTNLYTFYAEGLQLRHIRMSWGVNYSDSDGGMNCNSVVYIRPHGGLAEVDCVIEGCQIDSYKWGEPINIQGRGVYIQNNVIHHPFGTGAWQRCMIRLVGYAINDDKTFFRPKDANRATVIKDNRFHVGLNNYIVWFDQDPNNADSTFSNVIIEGNLGDFGCWGIYSTSRMRNININGNVFNVKANRQYEDGTWKDPFDQFNYFGNSINGLSFANNVISTPEQISNDDVVQTNVGETWFEYTSASVEFENINFSNNTFDIPHMSCAVRFDGRLYGKDNESYPTLRQFTMMGNTFSDRCFQWSNISMTTRTLCSLINTKLNNCIITGNSVVDNPSYTNPTTGNVTRWSVLCCIIYISVNDTYPQRTYSCKNSVIAFNPGTYRDLDLVGSLKYESISIITSYTLRTRATSGYRDFTEMSDGDSIYDYTVNKPLWWDGHKWGDANGFYAALSRGTTAQRPTSALTPNDTGFRYYDTNLNKTLVYKSTIVSMIVDSNVVAGTPTKLTNNCVQGNLYLLSYTNPYNMHSFYFCNANESDKLDIVDDKKQQLCTFVAPDPARYPYIVFTAIQKDTPVKIFSTSAWWEEEDGAKAGVRRSGTFAQAPIATDIYTGFMYMLVDGANNFPLYAKVSGNPAAVYWYKADGTQYNG